MAWLENDLFLNVYTFNEVEDDMGRVPASDYYIVQRRAPAPFLFQKLPDVCAPFGLKRAPAYHFIARLKNFKPHLQDALIISSTAAGDLGLITRSTHPLTDSMDAAEITKVFASTAVATEVRQAALPLSENGDETSTIGLGVDLSSTDTVGSPIHGADLAEAATPQPNVLALNNEGILASWWFIYSESIRQKEPYPGLSVVQDVQQQPLQPAPAPQTAAPAVPASGFGSLQAQKPTFGQPSFGQPSYGQSTFGSPQPQSLAFGKPSAPTPAFGTPSALGGASNFGSSTPMKPAAPAFGSPSTIVQPGPQFGQTGFGGTPNPSSSFGQTSGLGGKGFSSFASPGAGQSSFGTGIGAGGGGGFSAFSSGEGFGALASSKPSESPFSKPAADSPFGKPSTSVFGSQPDTSSPFGSALKTSDAKEGFGLGSGSFVLGSSFKPDDKANDNDTGPAKSSGVFSMGTSFNNLLTGSTAKPSPPAESMDDMEDEPAETKQLQEPKSIFSQLSSFDATQSPITAPPATSGPMFGTQSQSTTTPASAQKSRPTTLFGNGTMTTTSASPLSSPSENTIVPSLSFEKDHKTPVAPNDELPLPPDATSRAVYGPGDTSASSNVSKSSYEEAPLPSDFTRKSAATKPEVDDAPLPPDFLTLPKKTGNDAVDDAPLPPDFLSTPKKTDKSALNDAPLPPDFLPTSKPKSDMDNHRLLNKGESIALPKGSEGSDGDFEDSGEEITHDVSPPSESAEIESASFKTSPESSFGGPSLKNPTGGLFTKITQPNKQQDPEQRTTRNLFGEIPRPNLPPPKPRSGTKSPRSPSPVRPGARRDLFRPEQHRSISAPGGPERALGARKVTLGRPAVSRFEEALSSSDLIEEEESKAAAAEMKRLASEAQTLSSDDEDERLRADLARPLSPVPALDPFVPRQEYSGESFKPGIPGQIERLYRDINSMVDTLGLNSRSISSYILHEEQTRKSSLETWKHIMVGDSPLDILDEDLAVSDIDDIDKLLGVLQDSLEEQRLRGVQDKLDECQQLISRDIFILRGQCATIQKTLDSYTNTVVVRSASLSAEQATLQQDLRKASAAIQSQLADLEQAISLLRAKIADSSRHDGANGSVSARRSTKKPTVEAVTSTISTMMSMAENKSSDIDVLESQMKKLGLDLQGSSSREGSPLTTPLKRVGFKVPATPDSDRQSSYHTPESTSMFRSSMNGSARHSRLRSVNNIELDYVSGQDSDHWKARAQRRKEIIGNLKVAVAHRHVKVRTLDDV